MFKLEEALILLEQAAQVLEFSMIDSDIILCDNIYEFLDRIEKEDLK